MSREAEILYRLDEINGEIDGLLKSKTASDETLAYLDDEYHELLDELDERRQDNLDA